MSTAGLLLEREMELARLRAAGDAASAGSGRLVLVEAPAGTGKSTLLESAVRGRGGTVLRARGGELERDYAFGGIRQLLGGRLAQAPPPARALADPDERVSAGFGLLHALHWVIAGLAAAASLTLVIDDLQWFDEDSLHALDFIARRIADLPVFILCALRPAEPRAPLELLDRVSAVATDVVTPRPLSRRAVAGVVRAQAPAASDAVCAAVHDATAGNPLYVRELLRAVDPLAADAADRIAGGIPTLGERVGRRIEPIAPDAPGLAAAMAVVGDGARLATAATLAEVQEEEAAAIAHQLVRVDVLVTQDPIAFTHPLIRASVYEALPLVERSRLHARAAAIEPDLDAVAKHLALTRPVGSPETARRLLDAAREATGRAAPDAAVRRLRRALDEDAADPPRAELLYELGRAEMSLRLPEAATHLREAHALAEDPSLRARAALTLTDLLSATGEWEAMLALFQQAMAETPPGAERLELEAIGAVARLHDSRLAATLDADWARLETLVEGNAWGAHAIAAALASGAAMRGHPREVVFAHIDRALAGGTLLAERPTNWASAQVMFAELVMADRGRVAALGERIAAEGARTGALLATFISRLIRAADHAWAGELPAAEAEAETLRGLAEHTDQPMWAGNVAWSLLPAVLERPGLREIGNLAIALEIEPAFEQSTTGAMLHETRGALAAVDGDRAVAVAELRAAGEIFTGLRAGPRASSWRSRLALELRHEHPAEAQALAAEELALAEAADAPRAQGIALRTLGLVTGERVHLEASVAVLEASEARLEHAYSLVALGGALRRAHRRSEAREHLEAGIDLAHRCGAERLVDRALPELRATGAKPRRRALRGVEALTARELHIAQLVADGRSNAAIAQDLFVSVKTVETHLSRAYAKLEIAGLGARSRLGDKLSA